MTLITICLVSVSLTCPSPMGIQAMFVLSSVVQLKPSLTDKHSGLKHSGPFYLGDKLFMMVLLAPKFTANVFPHLNLLF